MLVKDSLEPQGYLTITLKYNDGREVVHFNDKNLITNTGRMAILNALVGLPNSFDPISQLRAGSGGCIDPAGKVPREEDPKATGLIAPFLAVSVSYTLDNTNIMATILADIDQSTANSQSINEIGLFTKSGRMFNVKNFPYIPKTSEFSVHVEWRIKVV